MTAVTARRLLDLYDLRRKVDAEIKRMQAVPRVKRPKAGQAVCGTDGGYYRHIRTTKTTPCGDCRRAHCEYEKLRSARARKVA